MAREVHRLSPTAGGQFTGRSFKDTGTSISVRYESQHRIYLTHDQILELALYVLEKRNESS